MRVDLDVRRLWLCAACNTQRHTGGDVTLVVCHFCQDHPLMSLVEPQRADRQPAGPPDMRIELHPDDVDAPAFVPVHLRDPETEPAEESDSPTDADSVDDTATHDSKDAEAVVTEDVATETVATETDAANPSPADQTPSPQADEPNQRKKSRRKKTRRRKNRPPENAANESQPDAASTEASVPKPDGPAASPDDSFGAGLDPN